MSSVALVIFILVIMPCSVGYGSLLIWLIVMLYPHDYVDIMLMHCNCNMLFYHGSAYCNQDYPNKIELEQVLPESWCHLIEVTSATMLAFMGVLTGSIAMPLAGASNEGKLWVCGSLAR